VVLEPLEGCISKIIGCISDVILRRLFPSEKSMYSHTLSLLHSSHGRVMDESTGTRSYNWGLLVGIQFLILLVKEMDYELLLIFHRSLSKVLLRCFTH